MKKEVLGVKFDDLTRQEAAQAGAALLEEDKFHYVVTPNPEFILAAEKDGEFLQALNDADLALADGIGVVYSAKLQGVPLKGRVPGIEFAADMLSCLNERGGRLYLLGAKPGVAEEAGRRILERHPNITLCGTQDGYFKDEENPDNVRLMEYMDGADCLFLCVDGAHFNHDTRNGIINAINCDGGGMELNFMLNRAAVDRKTGNDKDLPPVCLIITKYDLVEPDKRNEEFLVDILKEVFPILFYPSVGQKSRLVSVCPVTLGRDIGQGGKLEPRNIEKPFCYLTFLRMAAALGQYRQEMEQMKAELLRRRASEEAHRSHRLLKRLLPQRPGNQVTEEELGRMVEACCQLERDLMDMKRSLQNMELFDNGQQIPWDRLIETRAGKS